MEKLLETRVSIYSIGLPKKKTIVTCIEMADKRWSD